jgi:DNA-directed RNA polymerase specialized sigma subunit
MAYRELIEDMLTEWGKAARQGSIHINYKPGILGQIKGSTVRSATITDKDYMLVDQAVSELKKMDAQLHDVISKYYLEMKSMRRIGMDLRKSTSTISQYKESAITYVACYVNLKS